MTQYIHLNLNLPRLAPSLKREIRCGKRTIGLLVLTISKVLGRILHDQISDFMKDKLSKYLCGFRKNYNTQHALLYLIQNWQYTLDKGGIGGTILMDLSKSI